MSDVVLNADKVDLVRERRVLLDRVTMTVLRGSAGWTSKSCAS